MSNLKAFIEAVSIDPCHICGKVWNDGFCIVKVPHKFFFCSVGCVFEFKDRNSFTKEMEIKSEKRKLD